MSFFLNALEPNILKPVCFKANPCLVFWIAVALIQGLFALSPTPVDEDEWESFQRMLRDPAFRLPTTTRPRNYEVNLTPFFETAPTGENPFSFRGSVTIYTKPTVADVNEIVLHCNNMTILSLSVEYQRDHLTEVISYSEQNYKCEMPYSFLRIPVKEALQENQEYIIKSEFRGHLQTNMRGFYRSWYNDSVGKR